MKPNFNEEDQYTNGTYVDTKCLVYRTFRLIHEHDGHMWVQALNGNFKNEYLTFESKYLRKIIK